MNKFHLSHKGLLSSIALAFSLFFTLGTTAMQAQDGSEFAGGNGTEKNPWQIATKQQLAAINNYQDEASIGKYFILNKDLEFTAEDFSAFGDFYNDGNFWEPLGGDYGSGFCGNFDGGNHEISGLKSNYEYFGLFYQLKNASVKNLKVSYGNVNFKKRFGGISSLCRSSIIDNCHVTGDFSTFPDGTDDCRFGGIISEDVGGGGTSYVINCSFKGNITSDTWGMTSSTSGIGGIAGSSPEGSCLTIADSFVEANIDGEALSIGGMIGKSGPMSVIQNCYVIGNIRGSTYVGGFVGVASSFEGSTTISQSYFSGDITGGRCVGGLIGVAESGDRVPLVRIIESYSEGEIRVNGNDRVYDDYEGIIAGGLVGFSYTLLGITDSYSHCNISGLSTENVSIGGLVGCCCGHNVSIQRSYAMGEIKGDQSVQTSISGNHAYLGGLVGYRYVTEWLIDGNLSILKCVGMNPSLIAPHGDKADTGRIMGAFDKCDLTNNYALDTMVIKIGNKDVTVTGTANDKNGQNKTAAELARQSTYTDLGWDFDNIWKMSVNGYPIFIWQEDTPIAVAPTIITQPISQTVNEGSSVTFSVVATGTEPLSYQWYKDSTLINGATDPSYTIGSAKTSDADSYYVIVSNSVGNAVSSIATLTVKAMPRIIEQPKSQTVNEGDSVTFTVVAEDGSSSDENTDFSIPLSNNVNLDMVWIEPGTFMMGSPTDELGRDVNEAQHQVTLTQGYWLGKYEVTQAQYEAVTDSNPSALKGANLPVEAVTWNEAMAFCEKLTAQEKAAGRLPEGYEYTLPTEAQWEYACRAGTTTSLNSGKNITSTVECPNMDEVGWYRFNSGDAIYPDRTRPVGQKKPNAWGLYDMHGNVCEWCLDRFIYPYDGEYPTIPVVDPTGPDTGSYRMIRGGSGAHWAGSCRSAHREGTIPNGVRSDVGIRVALVSVQAQANATADTLTYQWYKDGVAISEATGSSYTIKNVKMSDAGAYTVKVSNSVGYVISEIATLTVIESPKAPVIIVHPASQTVDVGEQVTFSVVATGTEPLNYQWLKNGVTIPGATKASYTITSAQLEDAGNYMVIVSNSVGMMAVSNSATLTVKDPAVPPVIIVQPMSQEVLIGESVTFSVVATGTEPLSYQWLFNGNPIPGATGSTYSISQVTEAHAGNYSVIVSNVAGTVISSTAVLTVKILPPVIVMHPQTQIIMRGSTATFAVIAEGYGLSYQWTFNGKDIAGANQPVYMIPAAEAVNVGSYAVKVSNKAGSVTSQSAMLWLNNLQMYAGVEVYGPIGAKFTVWYKDDAESGEWKKLTSSTVSASPTVVIDYDSPQNKKRFYKVEIE